MLEIWHIISNVCLNTKRYITISVVRSLIHNEYHKLPEESYQVSRYSLYERVICIIDLTTKYTEICSVTPLIEYHTDNTVHFIGYLHKYTTYKYYVMNYVYMIYLSLTILHYNNVYLFRGL